MEERQGKQEGMNPSAKEPRQPWESLVLPNCLPLFMDFIPWAPKQLANSTLCVWLVLNSASLTHSLANFHKSAPSVHTLSRYQLMLIKIILFLVGLTANALLFTRCSWWDHWTLGTRVLKENKHKHLAVQCNLNTAVQLFGLGKNRPLSGSYKP